MAARVIDGSETVSKACHQCRHSSSSVASCESIHQHGKKVQQCSIHFCRRCLLNRYGESLEVVFETSSWSCPKCRGICNCSKCMKKRGYQPTGNMIKATRARGFQSVLEMLHNNSLEHAEAADNCAGTVNASLSAMPLSPKGLKRKHDSEFHSLENDQDGDKKILFVGDDKKENISPLKRALRVNGEINWKDRKASMVGDDRNENICVELKNTSPLKGMNHVDGENNLKMAGNKVVYRDNLEIEAPENYYMRILDECVFPKGSDLMTVANVEFSEFDVGPALQFLEFCATFAKVLDLRKGQAESVLRELSRGIGRRGLNSSLVQFHIKLIDLLRSNAGQTPLACTSNKDNGWLQALETSIVESKVVKCHSLKEMSLDFINKGISGYDELDTSEKMQILNFLCDEMLGTELLRSLINKEKNEYIERSTKEERRKEEFLKEAVVSPNNISSISVISSTKKATHDEMSPNNNSPISAISSTKKATHDEIAKTKRKPKPDVLGTESVLFNGKGGVFWRMKGCCDNDCSGIMLQEISSWDSKTSHDKWSVYNDEENKEIEKNISFLKDSKPKRRRRRRRITAPCRRRITAPHIPSI